MLVSFNSNTTGITSGAGTANLSGNLSSSPHFSGILVARSLFVRVIFVDCCFSFCYFPFDHCIICPFFGLRILITALVSSRFSLPFKNVKSVSCSIRDQHKMFSMPILLEIPSCVHNFKTNLHFFITQFEHVDGCLSS